MRVTSAWKKPGPPGQLAGMCMPRRWACGWSASRREGGECRVRVTSVCRVRAHRTQTLRVEPPAPPPPNKSGTPSSPVGYVPIIRMVWLVVCVSGRIDDKKSRGYFCRGVWGRVSQADRRARGSFCGRGRGEGGRGGASQADRRARGYFCGRAGRAVCDAGQEFQASGTQGCKGDPSAKEQC